jgi:hypothetical protein
MREFNIQQRADSPSRIIGVAWETQQQRSADALGRRERG